MKVEIAEALDRLRRRSGCIRDDDQRIVHADLDVFYQNIIQNKDGCVLSKAGMGRTRENVELMGDLKLKLLVVRNVGVVRRKGLLGLNNRRKQERQEGDNNLECAGTAKRRRRFVSIVISLCLC